jgi:hypothetical protein
MASRFISAGSLNISGDPTQSEEQTSPPPSSEPATKEPLTAGEGGASAKAPVVGVGGRNQKEWERVQREIEKERKAREQARMKEVTGEERSLFDILQANKGE